MALERAWLMQPRSVEPISRRNEFLLAARHELSMNAYEQVGLRQIAARGGMDTAKLMREFGSKEQLLTAVLDDLLETAPVRMPATWTNDFAAELAGLAPVDQTEPFRILAYSAPSPNVEAEVRSRVPALLERIEAAVEPGPQRSVRALMAASLTFGVIITKDVIGLEPPGGGKICAPLVAKLLNSLHRAPAQPGSISQLLAENAEARPFGVAETKSAILKAADAAFSLLGYEHASVRRIASDAQVDPALVIRYFGSKEALFEEVLHLHFAPPPAPDSDFATASIALEEPGAGPTRLDITLRSAASPVARKIIKRDLEERFTSVFADPTAGEKAEARALMRSALFLGASFCNCLLRPCSLQTNRTEAREQLTALFRMARTGKAG